MIKTMFYIKHQRILYNHAMLVDETTLKKNKLIQKSQAYGEGKQLVMP